MCVYHERIYVKQHVFLAQRRARLGDLFRLCVLPFLNDIVTSEQLRIHISLRRSFCTYNDLIATKNIDGAYSLYPILYVNRESGERCRNTTRV